MPCPQVAQHQDRLAVQFVEFSDTKPQRRCPVGACTPCRGFADEAGTGVARDGRIGVELAAQAGAALLPAPQAARRDAPQIDAFAESHRRFEQLGRGSWMERGSTYVWSEVWPGGLKTKNTV